jgi:CRISPR type IV-associated protein Csf2
MSAQAMTDAGPQQMMYYVESFAAGTRFYWRVLLTDATDVEFEAFLCCLAEFSKAPYLGGRSAAGLGHVAMSCVQWRRIDSRLSAHGEAIDVPIGTRYQQHLQEHGHKIRALLDGML